MSLEHRKHELVEETPLFLEKFVEKDPVVLTRNHRCEKAENPLSSVDVGTKVEPDEIGRAHV